MILERVGAPGEGRQDYDPCLRLDAIVHLDLRSRNCDRTVQWSPAFEGGQEQGGLLAGYSLKPELQPDGIEQG